MYIIGKYLTFIVKKSFSVKCKFGVRFAHGQKLIPYVTLSLHSFLKTVVTLSSRTVAISFIYDQCSLL